MGKEKNDVLALEGKKVESVVELGNGYVRITFSDGASIVANVVPLKMTVTKDSAKPKGKVKEEEVEDEEEEDDDDEVSVEDMKEALIKSGDFTKKDLKKMSDEEIETAYDDLEEDEDDEDDEDEDDDEEESDDDDNDDDDEEESDDDDNDDEDEEEDEALTAKDLKDSDFDDLEDIIDDKELEIDIEDFDAKDKKSVEQLRKAVAKALKIKL